MKEQNKSLTILGVDPGTQVTGFGLIRKEGGRYIPLDFGCIRTKPSLKLSIRYLHIYRGIEELIEKFKPQALSVESQYVAKNVSSAMKLGMARSVIMLAATKKNIPVFEYTPSRAKQAVTGSGRASKEQVQKMVQKLLFLKTLPTPEDAADALALAICHAHASHLGKEI